MTSDLSTNIKVPCILSYEGFPTLVRNPGDIARTQQTASGLVAFLTGAWDTLAEAEGVVCVKVSMIKSPMAFIGL